jgi:FtsP/CotA-like multicopper oxidase with cupredoxin domain
MHQMKVRLARAYDSKAYGIKPESIGTAFANRQLAALHEQEPVDGTTWHDALPVPRKESVFVVMNFDATAQLGKFVFPCRILEHEDMGLMNPIEVIR